MAKKGERAAPFAGGEAADEGQTFYADMDKLCARLDTAELAETYGTTNIGFLVFLPVAGCSFTMVHYLEDGSSYAAATNVGVRPTVSNSNRANVESHILDFSGNLYGRRARVEFYDFIRPEMKFDDVETLAMHIKEDSQTAKNYFK